MCEAKHITYICSHQKTKILLCLAAYNKSRRRRPTPCPENKRTKVELVPQTKCAKCIDAAMGQAKNNGGKEGAEERKVQKIEESEVGGGVCARGGGDCGKERGIGGGGGDRDRGKKMKGNEDEYFEGDDLISFGCRDATCGNKEEGEESELGSILGVGKARIGMVERKDTKENRKGLFVEDDLIAFE
ncbi:MAG: hypothetical protein M1835_007498 [Candelina submexicana]|nr:MAG: hypothetical protein M1835_007498 [Candelina submexicana]